MWPNSLDLLVSNTIRYINHLFFWGWARDIGPTISDARQLPAILAGLAMGAVTLVVTRGNRHLPRNARFWLIVALFGFLLMGLGFGPYLFTGLRDTFNRTVYVAMIGAALVITGGVLCALSLQPRLRIPTAILLALLAGVGTFRMIGQQESYAIYSSYQTDVAEAVYDVTGTIAPGTTLVIQDESSDQYLGRVFATISTYAEYVFALINHPNPVRVVLCYPEGLVWGAYGESCTLDADGVNVDFSTSVQSVSAPLSDMVIVRYADDGTVTLVQPADLSFAAEGYQPEARIQPGVLPERAATIFGMLPDEPRN